jgi:hypothetical protein
MALLVQRVSGAVAGSLFYPQIAGVGLSYNPYAWSKYIQPEAGAVRVVFGLGTRAVNRSDDDYTRVVALNDPTRRPEADYEAAIQYAQRRVDVLDLKRNRLCTLRADEVVRAGRELPVGLFASPQAGPRKGKAGSRSGAESRWVLTFDRLLTGTPFVRDMREMLRVLQAAYEYPVDVEFTANFSADERYRINVVQCRPLQIREGGSIVDPPAEVRPGDLVLECRGGIIGQSSSARVDRVIYVVPSAYGRLPISDRYTVARLIGRLTHVEEENAPRTVMLLGPGRWGTQMPSLGVPVSFAEINTVSVLCEVVAPGLNVIPDVSLGTHFFNDLVEANILYLAVFPAKKGHALNEQFLLASKNRLPELLPDEDRWSDVIRVIDLPEAAAGAALFLNANAPAQRALCYLSPARA